MQFKMYGKALDELTSERLRPMEKAREFIFARLNGYFEYLLGSRPELLIPLEEGLTKRVQGLGVPNQSCAESALVAALSQHHTHLAPRQDLTQVCLDAFLDALDLSIDQLRSNEEVEVTQAQFQASAMRVDLQFYLALRELVGRDEAVRLNRDAIAQYVKLHDGPAFRDSGYGTLHDLRFVRARSAEVGYCGRIRIVSTVENGMLIERCENCEKVAGLAEAGIEFEDPEVFDTLLCSSDFAVTRLFNDAFVMTRHKTIAGGHPYCDNVFHDLRIVNTVEHPDDDFIARIHTMCE